MRLISISVEPYLRVALKSLLWKYGFRYETDIKHNVNRTDFFANGNTHENIQLDILYHF